MIDERGYVIEERERNRPTQDYETQPDYDLSCAHLKHNVLGPLFTRAGIDE